MGTGLVKNAAGPSGDQSLSSSTPCNLALTLYNNGSGMILRLDGGPPIPPSFESDTVGCALPIHTAINGKFVKRKIGGVTSSDFVFSVPPNLKHPLTGVDNSVRRSDNLIKLRTVKKQRQEARLLREDRVQGRQAPRACDLQDGGHRELADPADVHGDEERQVLAVS